MNRDILFNFISPVTGRILSDENYVLYGNRLGIAIPSPIITDIRLDLISLRTDYSVLSTASFITGFPNEELPNAQVLSNKSNGFLFNSNGLVSTFPIIPIGALPNLPMGNIWIGNDMNRPTPNPTISIANLPELPEGNIWTGSDINRPIASPTIAIDNLPNLSSGKVWIGNGMVPSRPVEGLPPQGPPGPPGPAGKAAAEPNSLANSLAGNGFGSVVKFGLDQLMTTARDGIGKALLAIYGAGVAIHSFSDIADTIIDAVDVSKDHDTKYIDYRTTNFTNSLLGLRGAEGLSGLPTLVFYSNISIKGGRLEDLAPSPEGDYDAVNAKWVWDLLNNNVEIIWQ